MLRVLFDTNVYGHLLTEEDGDEIKELIKKDKEFVVYGYSKIRIEIRDIPKITKLSCKARIALLCLYDDITGGHMFRNSIKINTLAKKYYDCYRNFEGIYGWDTNIRIDFMIVACASINGLDVVYSDDTKTMLGKASIKSYHHINLKENLRTPNLLKYQDLLTKYRNQ